MFTKVIVSLLMLAALGNVSAFHPTIKQSKTSPQTASGKVISTTMQGCITPRCDGVIRVRPSSMFRRVGYSRQPTVFDILEGMESSMKPSASISKSFIPVRGNLLIDAKETPTSYEIVAEIPGVEKSDISISLKQNELIISAEKKALKKEEGETFKRTERYVGTVSRTLVLPEDAAGAEKVEASYENGVLYVTVPKLEIQEPQVQTIEIKERTREKKEVGVAAVSVNDTPLSMTEEQSTAESNAAAQGNEEDKRSVIGDGGDVGVASDL